MHHDEFTKKLIRIIETIERDELPAKVRELYVFGSYARGALEPGDLDLVIVHGAPRGKHSTEEAQRQIEDGSFDLAAAIAVGRRFEPEMRSALRDQASASKSSSRRTWDRSSVRAAGLSLKTWSSFGRLRIRTGKPS